MDSGEEEEENQEEPEVRNIPSTLVFGGQHQSYIHTRCSGLSFLSSTG